MKKLPPETLLLILLLVGVAASGWLYGLHWKKVAVGEAFTPMERQLIFLQDQVDVLTEENEKLTKEINLQKASKTTDNTTDPTRSGQ